MHDHALQLDTPGLKLALSGVSALYNPQAFQQEKGAEQLLTQSFFFSHMKVANWGIAKSDCLIYLCLPFQTGTLGVYSFYRETMCLYLELKSSVYLFQDVFLMIRRGQSTIFMDAKESTSVQELKEGLQGITKRQPEDIKLFKEEQVRKSSLIQ